MGCVPGLWVCAVPVSEPCWMAQNMRISRAMSRDARVWGQAPRTPGVLRVMGHHASPAPLPTASEFSVG